MFAALDTLMAADLSQMELYYEMGRLVSGRRSKGAAVDDDDAPTFGKSAAALSMQERDDMVEKSNP